MTSEIRQFFKEKINANQHFKEIVHGAGLTFSAKIFGTLAALGTSLIVARYYGSEMVGVVAIINAVLVVCTVFSLMGTDVAVLRLVPECLQKYTARSVVMLHKKMTTMVIFFSLIISVVLLLSSSIVSQVIFHNDNYEFYILLSAFFILIKALSTLNMEAIRGLQKIRIFAFMQAFPNLLNFFLIVTLTLFFYQKNNPIYALFANLLITSLILFILIIFMITKIKTNNNIDYNASYKYITSLSFPMFLTSSILMVIYQSDTLMLGYFRTESEVGIYAISLKLSILTIFVLNSINSLAAPKFAQLYHAGDLEQLKTIAQNSTKLAFWVTLPIILIYVFFGYIILGFFGQEFVTGYLALLFLTTGQLVNVSSGAVGLFLDMTGHEKVFRNIVVLTGMLNVILNLILIPLYHINGAAIASMVSIITWNVLAGIYIKNKFGFSICYVPWFKGNPLARG